MISKDRRWWPGALLIAFLACFFGAIAPGYVAKYQIPFHSALGIYCCFLLMLVVLVAPGVRGVRSLIEERIHVRGSALILLCIWSFPYLAYAAGTRDFRWLALVRLVLVGAPLLAIYKLFPVRDLQRFAWQDLLIAGWLIWVLMSHQLAGIWSVPANLDFMGRLFLIAVAAWCWVFVRKVPGLGYDFRLSGNAVRAAAVNFLWFAMIAVPAGLALHFIKWNPHWQVFPGFFVTYVELFLFVALLEELFFRGFLQTLVSENLGSGWKGQLLISCIFGLFHILHAPFPNWRYVLLATVAGWFYGSAFVKGGNLMASASIHALVDTVWRTFFLKG